MASHMSVVFLGTSSGGGPSESRNCSSLVCDMLADQSLWMVDCAEGTTRQFALQPAWVQPRLNIQKVSKVFVTHMHVDHVMGLIALLRNVLQPPPLPHDPQFATTTNSAPAVDIYGPSGLRMFIRQNLKITRTCTNWTYAVHELLCPHDPVTPSIDAPRNHPARMDVRQVDVLHYSEQRGKDLRAGEDGLWRGVTSGGGRRIREVGECVIWVDAGPIMHRDPCIGYVFTESMSPARKLVILGDTFDPSAILPLCTDASLLIHEATDSHISPEADPYGKLSRRTKEQVKERALGKGHSVPEMAGEFARKIGANALVLNHIGGRFSAPRHSDDTARIKIIRDIEKNAESAWGSGKRCIVAYDFLRVFVPMPAPIHAINNWNSNPPSTQVFPADATRMPAWDLAPQSQDASGSNIPTQNWMRHQTQEMPAKPPQDGQDAFGAVHSQDCNLMPQTPDAPRSASGKRHGDGKKRARSVERDGGMPDSRGDDNNRGGGSGARISTSGGRRRTKRGDRRGRGRESESVNSGPPHMGRGRRHGHGHGHGTRGRASERHESPGSMAI